MTELVDLLPHRPPMLLLDQFVAGEHDWAHANATVRDDSLFLTPGKGLPSWALIEYFAQTAALIGGLAAGGRAGEAPPGLLLGTRRFSCNQGWIPVGTELEFEARLAYRQDGGMSAYACHVLKGPVEADCTLNVFIPPLGAKS